MPRGNVSKLDYLRPEIIEKFLSGKTGGELVAEYSQIPRATVYRWLKEVKELTETNTRQPRSDEVSAPSVSQSKASLSLVTLPMSDKVEDTLPDLQYLKRKLRKIINTDGDNLSKNDGIRVNAINAYLKIVITEFGNKSVIHEEEDDTGEEETDYSKLSDEELTELYHKKLKSV